MIVRIINSAVPDGGIIIIVEHTDSVGLAADNQKLSEEIRLLKEYGLKNTVKFGSIADKGLIQPMTANNTIEGKIKTEE